jgi:hypothetical protein
MGIILLGVKDPLTSGPLPVGRGSGNAPKYRFIFEPGITYVHTIKAGTFIMDEILSIPTSKFRDAALEYPENFKPKLPY